MFEIWNHSYIFLRMKFHAASPVNSSHVSCSHLKDVKFEGLLYEDEVVVSHGKTVIVAGGEKGTAGYWTDDFQVFQGRSGIYKRQ